MGDYISFGFIFVGGVYSFIQLEKLADRHSKYRANFTSMQLRKNSLNYKSSLRYIPIILMSVFLLSGMSVTREYFLVQGISSAVLWSTLACIMILLIIMYVYYRPYCLMYQDIEEEFEMHERQNQNAHNNVNHTVYDDFVEENISSNNSHTQKEKPKTESEFDFDDGRWHHSRFATERARKKYLSLYLGFNDRNNPPEERKRFGSALIDADEGKLKGIKALPAP